MRVPRSWPTLLLASLALGACGSTTPSINASDATSFFRQEVAGHYHGHTATGDGRGCLRIAGGRYSCTAYVRGPGVDVIGTVTVTGANMTVNARPATSSETQAWFAKTPGGAGVGP